MEIKTELYDFNLFAEVDTLWTTNTLATEVRVICRPYDMHLQMTSFRVSGQWHLVEGTYGSSVIQGALCHYIIPQMPTHGRLSKFR